jgi:hypothetical protein
MSTSEFRAEVAQNLNQNISEETIHQHPRQSASSREFSNGFFVALLCRFLGITEIWEDYDADGAITFRTLDSRGGAAWIV